MSIKAVLTICALALAGAPAFAGPIGQGGTIMVMHPPSGIMLMRDSDGIVISVIHPPIDYWTLNPGVQPGGVFYTFGGHVINFSGGVGLTAGGVTTDSMGPQISGPGMSNSPSVLASANAAGTASPTVTVGGKVYAVEVAGKDVWLRDPVTGLRYAAERRVAQVAPDAVGHNVNPTAFTLD